MEGCLVTRVWSCSILIEPTEPVGRPSPAFHVPHNAVSGPHVRNTSIWIAFGRP